MPLGNKEWFTNNFAAYKNVREMDWWDETTWKSDDDKKQLSIACTPCQHFSGRGLFDRNQTLWSSWSILGTKRYFFGGYRPLPYLPLLAYNFYYFSPGICIDFRDTGYRSVADGQDEETVPRCPAFRQIGEKYGPFDLAWCSPTNHFSAENVDTDTI